MVTSLISSVKGTLEGTGPDWADVAVGGVTFRVSVPASLVDRLGVRGETVKLFTSLQVREDSLNLYGFDTEDARTAFDTLLNINGIGPRVALSVLSRFTPESLATAVDAADTNAFDSVPGIGKKTANRIVLELKGKLDFDWAASPSINGDSEVLDALTALGYTAIESRAALASLPREDALSVEDKVRMALQHMAGA